MLISNIKDMMIIQVQSSRVHGSRLKSVEGKAFYGFRTCNLHYTFGQETILVVDSSIEEKLRAQGFQR